MTALDSSPIPLYTDMFEHGPGRHVEAEVPTVTEAFLSQVNRRGNAPAILDERLDVVLTWRQYGMAARRASAGLRAIGLRRGDNVGLLLTNRPEFHVADIAVLLAGGTPFSLYQSSAPEQLAEILSGSVCRVVITEPQFESRVQAALRLVDAPAPCVVTVGTSSWAELVSAEPAEPDPTCYAGLSTASPSDLATVSYTAGTTGAPRGAELTHHAVMTTVTHLAKDLGVRPGMRSISYLPMAHIAERIGSHYLPMITGSSIVCCRDAARLVPVLGHTQPEIFFSPPRLWEKLKAATVRAAEAGVDPELIRRAIGLGHTEIALVGAAACPPDVVEYFRSIGVPLRESYGMTETAGVVSISALDDAGCVGKPLPHNEVRVGYDGELFVRSASMMVRYRDSPEATNRALDAQGWLHTGDAGQIDHDGRIWIVDRKTDLIINSSGTTLSPANIEARLRDADPLIEHACVIGNGRPYNVALVVVDPARAAQHPTGDALTAAVHAHIERVNQRLSPAEQVKRFALLDKAWLPDSDELTVTMKLRRRAIERKYAGQIDAMYAVPLAGPNGR